MNDDHKIPSFLYTHNLWNFYIFNPQSANVEYVLQCVNPKDK